MNRSLLLALLFWLPAASAFVQGPPAHSVRRCTNRHATHDDDAPAAAPATPRRKRDVLFFWRRAAKVLTNDHSGGLTRAQQLRVSELEAKVASLEVELEKNRAQLEPSIGRDADTPMVRARPDTHTAASLTYPARHHVCLTINPLALLLTPRHPVSASPPKLRVTSTCDMR